MAGVDSLSESSTVLDVDRQIKTAPLVEQLRSIQQTVGLSATEVARAYLRLAFGRGRLSFADYLKLRLFDQPFHAGASLDDYVGQRRNRDICVTANYRHDWFGMLSNKMATAGYLAGYGLPTIPLKAVYAPQLGVDKPFVLRDRHGLEAFLLNPDVYPLFGKPNESWQSLGSVALTRVHVTDRVLETSDGRHVPLSTLVAEVETHYASGYLFQPMMTPEASLSSLCGTRLACVRALTALTEAGPRLMRAVLKIPAGQNAADNYWRQGNLLAQVDLETGRILRVTSGTGIETRLHVAHPDTGQALIGFEIPQWQAISALAVEGARLMRHVPLIGWDIACTQAGPVIVEMNETPDFFLVQFADRRGIMTTDFQDFLTFQAKNSVARKRYMKASIAKL